MASASQRGRSSQRKGGYHERKNGKRLGELTGFTFQRNLEQRRFADHLGDLLCIDDAILPPAGVELCSDKEHLIWNQFTRARAKPDWRDMDLILLAKIVKMEADIRTAQVGLDAVGMMVENKRGTQIPNPLISIMIR